MFELRLVHKLFTSIILMLMLSVGCSRQEDAGGRAGGVIFFNGLPLTNGTIDFIPEGVGSAAYAQIEEDGTFEAFTGKSMAGIYPGKYKVTVNSWEVVPGGVLDDGTYVQNGISAIPLKYTMPETTDLQIEVNGTEKAEVVLELIGESPEGEEDKPDVYDQLDKRTGAAQ